MKIRLILLSVLILSFSLYIYNKQNNDWSNIKVIHTDMSLGSGGVAYNNIIHEYIKKIKEYDNKVKKENDFYKSISATLLIFLSISSIIFSGIQNFNVQKYNKVLCSLMTIFLLSYVYLTTEINRLTSCESIFFHKIQPLFDKETDVNLSSKDSNEIIYNTDKEIDSCKIR